MTALLNLLLGLCVTQANEAEVHLVTERPVYEFKVGDMHGYVRPIGHHHGLIINGHANQPITKARMCTMNLEHYVCADGHGPFVPRKTELQSYRVEGQRLTIDFAPTEEWKLESSLEYDFSSSEYIDVTFTFRFAKDYRNFEAFVASYMHNPVPPLLKTDGIWLRLQPERGWQMFAAKSAEHAKMVEDGRWSWFPDSLRSKVIDTFYDLPVLVTRDDTTGYALIQMVDPRECMGLSPNTFAPAHDLSLIGHDVKEGDVVIVPVRLLYRQIESMDEVEALYEEFLSDRNIPN